jgi:NADP-dependent 3-hydroxy acid dehydrogenase YdfG
MNLNGTTALVTGANGGLGEAIATALSLAGAKLILTGRRADALAPIAAKLSARVIVADLASRADVNRIAQEAGPVDVLVANAALPATGQFDTMDEEFLDRTLDVNLRVPILMARQFVASAYCQGTLLRSEIEARDASLLQLATDRATEAIARRHGEGPVAGKIQAHVIVATG